MFQKHMIKAGEIMDMFRWEVEGRVDDMPKMRKPAVGHEV